MLPFLEAIESRTKTLQSKAGVRSTPRPIFILGFVLFFLSFLVMPGVVTFALSLALFLAPLWLPAMLISGAWMLWLILKRSEFIAAQKNMLLEIKPPRTLAKTPLAMEAMLAGIHLSPGEGNWYKKYIVGALIGPSSVLKEMLGVHLHDIA